MVFRIFNSPCKLRSKNKMDTGKTRNKNDQNNLYHLFGSSSFFNPTHVSIDNVVAVAVAVVARLKNIRTKKIIIATVKNGSVLRTAKVTP